jgi:hypothetical protein
MCDACGFYHEEEPGIFTFAQDEGDTCRQFGCFGKMVPFRSDEIQRKWVNSFFLGFSITDDPTPEQIAEAVKRNQEMASQLGLDKLFYKDPEQFLFEFQREMKCAATLEMLARDTTKDLIRAYVYRMTMCSKAGDRMGVDFWAEMLVGIKG